MGVINKLSGKQLGSEKRNALTKVLRYSIGLLLLLMSYIKTRKDLNRKYITVLFIAYFIQS